MNNEKPIRDQAERLRKRVERKTETILENKDALPPRSEIHRKKQKKTNVKIKYPVIRLMALFFILLPITFFSIISYLDGGLGIGDPAMEQAGVEVIDVKGKNINRETDGESNENLDFEADEEDPLEIVVPSASAGENSGGEKEAPSSESGNGQTNSVKEKEKPVASTVQENGSEAAENQDAGTKNLIYHTVQPKETLFRVAMKYYKSQEGIPIIRKANNLSGNEIQTGQILKIPLNE